MKGKLQIAREITRYDNNCFISGGTASSLYYKHRIINDIDVWNFNGDLSTLPFRPENVNVINPLLTKITYRNINIDLLKASPKTPVFYLPQFIDGIRCIDIKDLIASNLHMIVRPAPFEKKTTFVDLYFHIKHFNLDEIIYEFKNHYQGFDDRKILKQLINFSTVEGQPMPTMFNCQITWDRIKRKIRKEVNNYSA